MDRALEVVARAQAQLEAVDVRMAMFKEQFRNERDDAVKAAIELGYSRQEIADVLGVTPQWVNKILRDEARRRRGA